MKTITLSEFETMAAELAEKFAELDNFYVQVMKGNNHEKQKFEFELYFNGWHAGGYADTPEKALEIAEKQYETRVKEFEVTINY